MKPARYLACVAAFALVACDAQAPDEPAAAPPAAVRAAPVESMASARETRAVGVLAPRNELRLAFKVGGIVEQVNVDAGDRVKRGQVLAELKRAEVAATVAQAEEAVTKAHRDLERARRLRADEVATDEQVQDLGTAYNVARADLETARFNARFARIEAPADGIVFERLAEGGELVQPGQPVIVLGATDSGWVVRTGLADRDAVRIDVGSAATVVFDAFPGREFAGTVTRVGASADRMTGTFEVEVEVRPDGARFARGLVGKVSLELAAVDAAGDAAAVVPITALVEANGPQATVYVLDAERNVARRKQVTLGPMLGEQVVVTAGLAVGEQVITDGAAWLSDGRAVRLVVGEDRG